MLRIMRFTIFAGCIVVLLAATSYADSIVGGFSVVGTAIGVNGATGATVGLNLATGLDFTTGSSTPTPGVAGSVILNNDSGNFPTALVGSTGAIHDFSFAGLGSANYPLTPLMLIDGFGSGASFTLTTVSITDQGLDADGDPFVDLAGTGTLTLNGFTPTTGKFSLTAQSVESTFSFSASQAATPVPEPGTVGLLGIGLAGIALVGARKRGSK